MNRIHLRFRAGWKFASAMTHIVLGFWTVVFVFPHLSTRQKEERIRAWALALLAQIAIKLIVVGRPPAQGPVLLASNHISWLDIVILQAACNCRFVSKSEIRRWPLIGTLAVGVGTLFIERESRRDARRVVQQMADSLSAGDVLAFFPEGTSSDGVSLLPFHGNLFQSAIIAAAPVLPVALQFSDVASEGRSLAPCYIDRDTLLGSIWRTLTAPPLCAILSFGEPQSAQGRDRRAWALDLRAEVENLRSGCANLQSLVSAGPE